ncbi:hypothetical protein ES703_117509 [subsurface metagenome]
MKRLFLIFGIIFLLSFVSAVEFCIDSTPPSAPSNLAVSGVVGNIILTWDEATDIPDCSGIDYYNITRDGNLIGTSFNLSFRDTENLSSGNYTYTVYAVDKVGHNRGTSIKNDVVLSKPTDNGDIVVSGGGGCS